MPFNVSGVFQRLFNWQSDRDAGIKILAQRMDQELDGIVAGINDMVAGNVDHRGPYRGVNGTVGVPAYSFTDDQDTGVYRSTANQLAFSVGGQVAGEFLSDRTLNLPYKLTIAGADVFADLNISITGLQTQIDTKASQTDMDAVPGQISAAINALVDTAPGTLDTLNELAAALGDDPNFSATITGQLALKADAASLGSLAAKDEVGTGDFNVSQSQTELGIGFETRISASWPQFWDGAQWVDFGAKAATIQRIADVETKSDANETAIAGLQWTELTPFTNESGVTALEFTSIPDSVNEIVVGIQGGTLSGNDNLLVQLGTASGWETAGYETGSFNTGAAAASAAGFVLGLASAARSFYGLVLLKRIGLNWYAVLAGPTTNNAIAGGGSIVLSEAVTGVRLTRTGSNTIDVDVFEMGYR